MTDKIQEIERMNMIALQHRQQGRFDEAVEHYKRALELAEQILGPADLNVPTFMNNIAAAYHDAGKHDLAEEMNKKALAIRIGAVGETHYLVAGDYTDLAHTCLYKRDFKGAEMLFEKSYSIFKSLPSEGETMLLEWLPKISMVLVQHQCLELAATYLQRAVELIQKNFGHSHQLAVKFQDFLTQVKTEIKKQK